MGILKKKIKNNKATIGIFGLGYVGLPLAINFSKKKIKVYGFDNDLKKINYLNNKKSYLSHVTNNEIKQAKKNGFITISDIKKVKNLDVIFICVPTPLKKNNKPELFYVKNTLFSILPYLRQNQLICLESTTYPGTTRELILPEIKKKGFIVGKNFYLAFSPERLDPGMKSSLFGSIPKIVGGITKNCSEISKTIYENVYKKIVIVSNVETAETSKLLENIFRAVNIGLVNELKIFTDKLNININEVIKAASTKPFGFLPFYPGPGLGGHCIPIDPFYLSWKASKIGVDTKFIKLAGKINSAIPGIIVKKIRKILKQKKKTKPKILILGVAYKKNINDLRESPGVKIIDILKKYKYHIQYNDPHIPYIPQMRNYNLKLKSIKLSSINLKKFDLTVLITDHDLYDYEKIYKHSKLIIDTRSVYSKDKKKVISNYYNI